MTEGPVAGGIEHVGRFAGRSAAVALIGAWAAAEAVVFPIVPDVGLGLLVLAAPLRALRLFGAVVVGAVAGTVVLGIFATQAPEAARAVLLSIPGIDPETLAGADRVLARDGLAGFGQFGPGAPLKVYTVEWLARGGDVVEVLVGAVLNRITRVGPSLVFAAAIGYVAAPWLRRHSNVVFVVYAAFWLLVYAAYFGGLL